ncbi:MAG: carboxypeptidase regulatory-like domain-containing protein [Pirellulaceae bacterium]
MSSVAIVHRWICGIAFCVFISFASSVTPAQDKTKEADAAPVPAGIPFSGNLADENGDPVTDAKITLQGPGYYRTTSDQDGHFEFFDADKPGEYRIFIESQKWAAIRDYKQMPKVVLMPGKAVTKDLVLPRACQVQVTVKDEDGNPIKGASVYCRSLGGERFQRHFDGRTDATGAATIGGIAPSQEQFIVAAQSKTHSYQKAIVTMTDPDKAAEATLVLQAGHSIQGKVLCNDGKPAAGWHLLALPSWWNFNSYPRGVLIGDDGSFELTHITDQPYNLTVSIPSGDNMSTSRGVQADAKLMQMKQPLQLKLDYPSPGSMSYLTGKIRWIGKPSTRGFSISGYSAQTGQHIHEYVDAKKTEFKVGPISPGIYRIRPESSELEVMNLRKIKNLDELDAVKIPNDEPIQIVLRVRGKPHVQGNVIDAETKKPIENYQYRITKIRTLDGPNYVQSDEWKVASSKQGAFQSEVVGPGVYSISILADGYVPAKSDQVNTTDEADRELEIAVKRGIKLQGLVVDEAGNPIDGAKVRALSMASGAMPRVMDRFVTDTGSQTTVDGKFTFDNLGNWETFRVDHPGYAFREIKSVKVAEDSPVLKIELTQGATIRGQVYDQDGRPQANETLLFQDDDSYGGGDREAGRFGQAVTDANGNYEIQHLPATVVYVSRSEEWESMGVVRHAVVTENGKVHRLNFGGTTKLTGQLMANEKPMANVRLQLGGPDSTFGAMKMFARSNDDGVFTFYGAPSGDWHLYREVVGARGDWAPLQIVSVPANDNVDLGEIRLRMGRLTVVPKMESGEIPEQMVVKFVQFNPDYMLGRDAAKPVPRLNPNDPFEFENVSTGDYELTCSGLGDFSIVHRLQLDGDQIDKPFELQIPAATATLNANVIAWDGKPSRATLAIRSEDGRVHARLNPNSAESETAYPPLKLPPGTYDVIGGFSWGRRVTPIARFELKADDDQPLEIQLVKPDSSEQGKASVRITDEAGVLIPCQVKLIGEGGDRVSTRMQLPDVAVSGPAGDYIAKFELLGFKPVERPLKLLSTPPNEKLGSEITVLFQRSESR